MRFGEGVRRVLRGGALLFLAATAAQAADRPFYRQAQNAFYGLPARDRNEAYLELMATGDFVAMASSDFGPRLYDATAQFQEMHGLQPSGRADGRDACGAERGRRPHLQQLGNGVPRPPLRERGRGGAGPHRA